MIRFASLSALLVLAACGDVSPVSNTIANESRPTEKAPEPLPDFVRVRLTTGMGDIVLDLDHRHAPITTANFVRYVEEGRLDGTSFYRAAPTEGMPSRGFVQGGIRRSYRRMLPPIAHEPTSQTGLRHEAGTISMARSAPGNAMGEFFITTARMEQMDADGDDPGFAAFGQVIEGMDVVRRILAQPTDPNAGSGAMRGQMLATPVPIVTARREPNP